MFAFSDFIGGGEEFAGLHRRQSLEAGWKGRRPARADQAGFGDTGDGDGVGLVAAQHEEMRVVLAEDEDDMATRSAALRQAKQAGEDWSRPRWRGAQRMQFCWSFYPNLSIFVRL